MRLPSGGRACCTPRCTCALRSALAPPRRRAVRQPLSTVRRPCGALLRMQRSDRTRKAGGCPAHRNGKQRRGDPSWTPTSAAIARRPKSTLVTLQHRARSRTEPPLWRRRVGDRRIAISTDDRRPRTPLRLPARGRNQRPNPLRGASRRLTRAQAAQALFPLN